MLLLSCDNTPCRQGAQRFGVKPELNPEVSSVNKPLHVWSCMGENAWRKNVL